MAKNFFIAGTPGVGKTTLIKEATLPFRDRVSGFYTEEILEGRARLGFRLKTFGTPQREGLLAQKGLKSPHKLGKYGVDLRVLETLGAASLASGLAAPGRLLVIDEMGSMEALSDVFQKMLLDCLQSPHPVLATLRWNSRPFMDHARQLADSELVRLTRENFPETKDKVRRWLDEKLS